MAAKKKTKTPKKFDPMKPYALPQKLITEAVAKARALYHLLPLAGKIARALDDEANRLLEANVLHETRAKLRNDYGVGTYRDVPKTHPAHKLSELIVERENIFDEIGARLNDMANALDAEDEYDRFQPEDIKFVFASVKEPRQKKPTPSFVMQLDEQMKKLAANDKAIAAQQKLVKKHEAAEKKKRAAEDRKKAKLAKLHDEAPPSPIDDD